MRLIDAWNLTMHEFARGTEQQYAILSHRWEDDEINFSDFNHMDRKHLANRKGFKKIQMFCQLARSKGLLWAWVDTCCIDKTSSSELSEAINSMFGWYEDCSLCCVYLNDVRSGTDLHSFRQSGWFQRGWTLQELIAPIVVPEFYTRDWEFFGTRKTLCADISLATHIPLALLFNNFQHRISDYCIAQRMSWAANRQTTRPEDSAYCLMGLFDINMPLLYGEGLKAAFRRLQLEIVRVSNDESIFAWSGTSQAWNLPALALKPEAFAADGNVSRSSQFASERSYSVTNQGLKIKMRVHSVYPPVSITDKEEPLIYNQSLSINNETLPVGTYLVAPIDCSREGQPLCLLLCKTLTKNDGFLARLGIKILPIDTQISNFGLRKVVLEISDRDLQQLYPGSSPEDYFPNLASLQRELKSKIRDQVQTRVPLDRREQSYDMDACRPSFSQELRSIIMEFRKFMHRGNELRIICIAKTISSNMQLYEPSFEDFESALLKFITPRAWTVSFLQRLTDECAEIRRTSLGHQAE